ncbi:MAG TPA: CPBP family intramembrane glutamic endopeptidase [Verrucomicrobiae bacterium]|nr:CPBP family intramembrane glutamic endopeptidase [Verrucomicrobiae bacterium]
MTFFEAVRRLSATERFLLAWGMVPLGGIPEYCDEALSDAIEYLNKSGGASDVKVQLLGTRVILRAETASFSRAEDDLGALMLTPAATNFVHAACALYSTNRAALNPNRPDNPFGIVEHGWARWRIESRWLRLNGDVSRAEWIERWQETQSQRKKWRYLVVFGVGALLQLAGLCVLAGFAIPRWRGMPQTVPLPLFEEMLFRGVLFVALRRRLSLVWAAAASGVVFGAIHFYALPGFAAVSAFGFLNAIAYEKTGSLAPCVAAHMLTNLLLVGGTSWIYS